MVRPLVRLLATVAALAPLLALAPAAARAAWTPSEEVKTYTIDGTSGAELYGSIGERGPQVGMGRVIAHTTFRLTWTRKYEPQNGGCTITVNKPRLIIVYTLPKPRRALSGAVGESWKRFIDGVRTHERVHGDHIIEMVEAIEKMSVGLHVENDPNCRRIRSVLTERLGELSREQRQRGRDFDRDELSPGGAVHSLILDLVNGP